MEAGNRLPSIYQHSGASSFQIGQVIGNVYVSYSSRETDFITSLSEISMRLLHERRAWEFATDKRYTPLDAEPIVSTIGLDLNSTGERPVPITAVIAESRRLMIVAGAGLGKTATLRHVAFAATDVGQEGGEVCLYIELSRFRRPPGFSPLDSILVLIAEALQISGAAERLPSLEVVRQLLRAQSVLLLLDGLNETAPEHRSSCLQGLQDFVKGFNEQRVVVTTRPYRFPPMDGWRMVTLRPLDKVRIIDFLEKRTSVESACEIYNLTAKTGSSLLHVPLFLEMVATLASTRLLTDPGIVNSRSALVATYVQHLTRFRPAPEPDPVMDSATNHFLGIIAETAQRLGLSLSLDHVINLGPLAGVPIRDILTQAVAIGVIATDGRYIRFTHHVLQEHYFSGLIAAKIVDEHFDLKPLAAQSSNDDALSHLPAHVSDETMTFCFADILSLNLPLCLRWADDLAAEERLADTVTRCISAVRRRAAKLRLYEAILLLNRSLGFRLIPIYIFAISLAVCLMPVYLASFVVRLLCESTLIRQSGELLGALRSARGYTIRQTLMSSACGIKAIREMAYATAAVGNPVMADNDGAALVADRQQFFARVEYLAHVPDESVPEYLIQVLQCRNSFARRTAAVLARRCSRYPSERDQVTAALWDLYRDETADSVVRRSARIALKQLGIKVGWRAESGEIGRRVIDCCFAVLWSAGLFLAAVVVFALFAAIIPGIVRAIPVVAAILVWRDASRLGAERIPGAPYFDSLAPQHYAVLVGAMTVVFLPMYIRARQRIRENGRFPMYIPAV